MNLGSLPYLRSFISSFGGMFSPTVIGLYGVSGSGKSWILSELRRLRPEFRCIEGSEVLLQVLAKEGMMTLEDFSQMSQLEQERIRKQAVAMIRDFRGITVVAGHAAFPDSNEEPSMFRSVITDDDKELYNAILYIDRSPPLIHAGRKKDNDSGKRDRPGMTEDKIREWIEYEKDLVRHDLCSAKGIYFGLVKGVQDVLSQIDDTILSPIFQQSQQTSVQNLREAIRHIPHSDVYLLLDGDRTLTPIDSGKIFISKVLGHPSASLSVDATDPLKQIFQRQSEYTWKAFAQVALLYERILPVSIYEEICQEIGTENVKLFSEWMDFLSDLPSNVHPVVVTAGIANVWKAALAEHLNWDDTKTTVIAGNHAALHTYVVDANAKAMVAKMLREQCCGCHILAFGDSVIDAGMLQSADRGYIILDKRGNTSLQPWVQESFRNGTCAKLFQLPLLSENDSSSQMLSKLIPGVAIGSLVNLREELKSGSFFQTINDDSKKVSAQVLASQSRRSDISGPTLQAVHQEIGRYLTDLLVDHFPDLVCPQSYPHVQGTTFQGVATVDRVLILPLMRGGEPMARGVYERFPRAKLVHYIDDMSKEGRVQLVDLVSKVQTIIIVDSVINQGGSVRRCLNTLHEMIHTLAVDPKLARLPQLVVLVNVMQAKASMVLPQEFPRVRFLALRISDNQYTGKGGTDTGNRLFGTI